MVVGFRWFLGIDGCWLLMVVGYWWLLVIDGCWLLMVVGYWYWVEPGAPSAHVSTHVNLAPQLPLSVPLPEAAFEQNITNQPIFHRIILPPEINLSKPFHGGPEVLFFKISSRTVFGQFACYGQLVSEV